MTLFLKKLLNIFYPNKATNILKKWHRINIYKNIIAFFFAITYKNVTGYEKNNKNTVIEH